MDVPPPQMSWFKNRSQQRQEPRVRFVGEQQGQPEDELKRRLGELFEQEAAVRAAYLAQVMFGPDPGITVALCLRANSDSAARIVDRVGGVFGAMFGRDQHLDILLLDAAQETEIAKVCRAFFVR